MTGLFALCPKGNNLLSEEDRELFINIMLSLKHRGQIYYVYNGRGFDKFDSSDSRTKITSKDLQYPFLLASGEYEPSRFLEAHDTEFAVISDGLYIPNEPEDIPFNSEYPQINEQLYVFLHKMDIQVSGDNFDTGLKKIVYGLSVNFQEQTSILVNGGKIYIIRDLLGIHPLFLCENNKFIAVASERKAFWKNKIYGTIERVLPGSIIQLNAQNKIYISQKYLSEVIPFGNRSPDQFLIKIKEAMIKSIQRRLCTVKNTPGSLFSGGLDSSLMQHFIDNLGVKSKSILIGMVGSKDIQQLDPPLNDLTRIEIEPENLFDKLTYILEMIEVPDSLLLEIGFLFLNAAEFSKKNGINGLFCGQGADELFAGYNKYLRALRISEGDYINRLNNDLDTQALKSIESCEMILSNFNGIHLLLPYLDIQVIDLVRRIDPIHLINLNKNIDKALLRIIAANEQGLSKLTLKKKSALQFSTRIHQTLDAFIRKLGFNREFSKEIGFKNHYRELFLNYIFHKLNYPSNLTNNQYEEINKKINY